MHGRLAASSERTASNSVLILAEREPAKGKGELFAFAFSKIVISMTAGARFRSPFPCWNLFLMPQLAGTMEAGAGTCWHIFFLAGLPAGRSFIMKSIIIEAEEMMSFLCKHPSYLVTKMGSNNLVELENLLSDWAVSSSEGEFDEAYRFYLEKGWAGLFDIFESRRREDADAHREAESALASVLCNDFFEKVRARMQYEAVFAFV